MKVIEDLLRQTIRIGIRLYHQRRDCTDEGGLRDTALAMLPQIMRYLTAAGGMADVNGVLQIEMRGQGRKIGGIVVHVMALAYLRGTSVTAPVMGDDAIAAIEEEQHLRVPVIRRQRPAMAKDDRLPVSPILIEDLDAVSGCHKWHAKLLLLPLRVSSGGKRCTPT